MLRIALCDDQISEMKLLHDIISEYLTLHGLQAEIVLFSHPDQLLTALETESFPLYLLDIVLPMISGLELGKEIRRHDREAQIVYITTEPQFALQAYAANPINYLLKPVDRQRLFDTLSFALSRINLEDGQTFVVKTAKNLRVLKLSDIAFCEYRNHAVMFTLAGGEELVSRTIRDNFTEYIAPLLKDKHFLQSHSSFVVNLRCIVEFAKDSFTMYGGKIVPIAAKQYAAVREKYLDYLLVKEGSR